MDCRATVLRRRVGAGFSAVGAAALLVATLAGCADEPDQVGFGGPPATEQSTEVPAGPSSEPATGPEPPPGGRALAEARVVADALPDGYPRVVWTETGSTVVGLYGRGGGCTEPHADLVGQAPDQVVVRIVEVTTSAGPCTMDLRYPPLTVTLDQPLGERSVVLERVEIGPPG